MNNNKKEELNYHNLNEVIGLSKKMLKILYTCVILAIIVFVIILFKNLEIFKVLGSILGVISPFFIGLVIAWLLDPAVTYLQKKNVKRSIGTIVVDTSDKNASNNYTGDVIAIKKDLIVFSSNGYKREIY